MVKGTVWTHRWLWELHRNGVATLIGVVTNWGYGRGALLGENAKATFGYGTSGAASAIDSIKKSLGGVNMSNLNELNRLDKIVKATLPGKVV